MTKVIDSVPTWTELRKTSFLKDKKIGFVPTMGALHEGHRSLLRLSRLENEISVLSIFINPTQFDDPVDLKNYPQEFEKDLELAKSEGVDVLFCPTASEMYRDGYAYKVQENNFSKKLCGQFRNEHFDGVLTIILKLFQLVKPTRAYFGEKDYQQYLLVAGLVRAFFLDVEVVPCPTIREISGLALSSRNKRFNEDGLKKASQFFSHLSSELTPSEISQKLEQEGFEVDYIENVEGRRYGAVKIDDVRLIDNVKL